MYEAGQSLKVDYGLFEHHGLADGVGYVIHNSKQLGMVARVSQDIFADGREILASGIVGDDSSLAVSTAMKYLDSPYDLFSANCEQFVRLCHGLEIESPQIQKYLLLASFGSLAIKSNNTILKASSATAILATLFTKTDESPTQNAIVAFVITLGIGFILN